MALMMKRMLCLRHVFIPRLIAFAPKTQSPSHLSILAQKNITHPTTPFADFAATRFNLSSADIEHILKYAPSLDKPKTLQNVKRVVKVLTKYGCSQHQVARIMRSHLNILNINAEKLVEPKLKLLKDLGIEKKDLPKILLKAPTYLGTSLQDSIFPNIAFLKTIFLSQKLLLKAMITNPYILTYSLEKNLRPSLAFWEGFGFEKEELARFLSSRPILLLCPSLSPPKVDLIRKIGVCKESKMYKHVLNVVVPARVETLESRMDVLRQWGLSDEEIWELFRTNPAIFSLSTDAVCSDYLGTSSKLCG